MISSVKQSSEKSATLTIFRHISANPDVISTTNSLDLAVMTSSVKNQCGQ